MISMEGRRVEPAIGLRRLAYFAKFDHMAEAWPLSRAEEIEIAVSLHARQQVSLPAKIFNHRGLSVALLFVGLEPKIHRVVRHPGASGR